MGSRLAAWVVCGPLGHFYAGVADVASALGRVAVQRTRRRLQGRGGRRRPPP